MGKRLYIGNLSYDVTELDLRDLFSSIGSVAEVKVVMDRETGRPRGFAFVEMTTDAEAQNAISQLNGRDVQGRAINVKEAEARKDSGGRGHGGGGGGWGGGGGGGGRRQRW